MDPPDAVPDRRGVDPTRFHPDGVETVAVIERQNVTQNSRSPTWRPAGAVAARVDGSATLSAQKTPVPAVLNAGWPTYAASGVSAIVREPDGIVNVSPAKSCLDAVSWQEPRNVPAVDAVQ